MRCPVSYYVELKGRQARVNTVGSSSTIRYYRHRLLFTRASLAFLNRLPDLMPHVFFPIDVGFTRVNFPPMFSVRWNDFILERSFGFRYGSVALRVVP